MKRPLYMTIASKLAAIENCRRFIADGREQSREWLDKHHEAIDRLVKEHLPSGSGFDCGTALDYSASTPQRLVFSTSFHHLNEDGYYDGWTEHRIIVTPSLVYEFEMDIEGDDRDEIHDYMAQVFDESLRTEIEG